MLLARTALGCEASRSTPALGELAERIANDPAAARPAQRRLLDAVLLFRPALLGPRLDSAVIDRVATSTGHPLLRAARAVTRHDTATARSTLSEFRNEMRVSGAPLTPDMVYSGASLLVSIGDTVAASEWLDGILAATRSFDPRVLADPTRTAAFIRATVLRADLASGTRDSVSARRWGAVAATLWRDADTELSAVAKRMSRYTRAP